MSKQGVYKISGNTQPKIGEKVTYTIDEWYPATPKEKRNPALVTWHLFKKVNGKFVPTNIKKKGIGSFTFQNSAYKNTYRIEAYLYEPEGKTPMALEVQPQPSYIPQINGIHLKYANNTPGTVFSFTEKLIAEAQCTGLEGKYLKFSLWEDDANNSGHYPKNLQIDRKKEKVISGIAKAEFTLTSALIKKAIQGETAVKQLEFYVTVEYYENKKHASENVTINTPQEIYIPSNKPQPKPIPPTSQPKVLDSPAAKKGQSQKEKNGIIETTTETISGVVSEIGKRIYDWAEAKGTVKKDQKPAPPPPSGKSPSIIKADKIENLLDAYFAKKEYTKPTDEEDGIHTYTFRGSKQNNKTFNAIEKDKVAQTILNNIKDSLKSLKKYTTLETISAALTAEAYGKDTVNEKTITFKTFKLEAEFKKVENAALGDKLYLVAKTMLLDGKQVKIIIKEKDGLINGTADSVLPILEITEEQMEQKVSNKEIPGTEKIEFSGVVKGNIVKIPIHLRPKSDEELKQWKEKINKGKENGNYTYKFGGPTNIKNKAEKTSVAETVLNNAKGGKRGNIKIEDGKTSSTEEIEKVLEIKNYKEGDAITFKLLKKVPELLYLNVKAQGEKQHDKEFLKKEGVYFQIGNKCICEEIIRAFLRTLRVGEGTGELIKSRDKKTNEIIYIPHDFDKGYTTAFGGNLIRDLSDHPRINYGGSTASGAYQVMKNTWDDSQYVSKKNQYNINSFSKENQDKFSILLMKHHPGCSDLLDLLLSGQTENAIRSRASRIWASLPEQGDNSRYLFNGKPQPVTPMKIVIEHYEKFLKEELEGKSPLHLKKGFLEEFKINCNCGNSEIKVSNNSCPDDCSQCFEYADIWENPEISNDNNGKNNNRFGFNSARGHKGIDIVSGPRYKDVHSLMCGEVTAVVDWFKTNEYKESSLGNTLMIKSKDKDGKVVFILYCHLDKVYVKKGDKIKHGQKVALSGSTGNASSDELPNGKKGRGIKKEFWHVHIEAATKGDGVNNFLNLGSFRIKAEDYMKTKFDQNGNSIK